MNLRTFIALLRGGQLAVLPAVGRATRDYHRVAFLAAGLHAAGCTAWPPARFRSMPWRRTCSSRPRCGRA